MASPLRWMKDQCSLYHQDDDKANGETCADYRPKIVLDHDCSQHCAHVLERWEIFFRPPTATPIATASMDLIYGD